MRRSCHAQHVAETPFGARGDNNACVPRQHRHGERQCGSTGHAPPAQGPTRERDLGHGGSQEESSAHKRLKPRWDVRLDAGGGTELQRLGSVPWSSGLASLDLWTAATRGAHDVKSWSQRGECSKSGTGRRLPQQHGLAERRDGQQRGLAERRDETNAYPSCWPNAQEEGTVMLDEKAMGCHCGHEDRARKARTSKRRFEKSDHSG